MPFYYQFLSWLHLRCNGSWLLFSSKLCKSCVELEYWLEYQRFTVEQCLLWTTCTGHHWLVALWAMIGANY